MFRPCHDITFLYKSEAKKIQVYQPETTCQDTSMTKIQDKKRKPYFDEPTKLKKTQ